MSALALMHLSRSSGERRSTAHGGECPHPDPSRAGRGTMTFSLRFRAAVVSIALFAAFLGIWHLATRRTGTISHHDRRNTPS